MLLEQYDLGLDPRALHVWVGLLLGLVFGVAAQISRFCLRRAVAGSAKERGSAAAVWLTALTSAVLGFAVMSSVGFTSLGEHSLISPEVPIVAIVLGGLCFGVGMVLARGCASRLTVLSATGNFRAIFVLIVIAITAHSAMKGVLAPVRTTVGSFSVNMQFGTVFSSSIVLALVSFLLAGITAAMVWRSRPGAVDLSFGAVIGFVAVAGWVMTSTLLFDEFDPLPVQTAAFIQPWSDTLFWTIASSAVPAGFGVGFIAGVFLGSFLSAAFRGELELQTFVTAKQTASYLFGGVLMGAGGVLSGGCTIGAGLSGVATGSLAAILALVSIVVGGWAANTTFRKSRPSHALA
ncbi:MAG: YeeE/YedE family protein [Pseudomonadota bacterium]